MTCLSYVHSLLSDAGLWHLGDHDIQLSTTSATSQERCAVHPLPTLQSGRSSIPYHPRRSSTSCTCDRYQRGRPEENLRPICGHSLRLHRCSNIFDITRHVSQSLRKAVAKIHLACHIRGVAARQIQHSSVGLRPTTHPEQGSLSDWW